MKIACALLLLVSQFASADHLAPSEAIRRAEFFVGQNGYTNWPDSKIKRHLDGEPLEARGNYREILRRRFNTLNPKAIGIHAGRQNGSPGWSIGFNYANSHKGTEACRVVTMNPDGSDIRLEHVDGQRNLFVKFGAQEK